MKKFSKKTQFRHIIDNVNDAVYTVDLVDNSFTSLNLAGEKMTGYKEEEFRKLKISQVIAPEYLTLVRKMIQEKVKKDVATIYEVEILKKDGTRLPVEISSRAEYIGDKPIEIHGVARDITERKQIEKQKEVFFSLITHELKNPLTSIKMYVDLLKKIERNNAHKKRSQYLDAIDTQLRALTVLMNDFLEVSKIRAGKFNIEKQPFNLDEVIKETVDMFRKAKSEHLFIIEGSAGKLVGDRYRIQQVLTNLLSNAMKYSPKGEKVTISLEKKKNAIEVSVRDFGIGIRKEDMQKIFELFYRTEHAEKGNISGHGLGLYISKEIIDNHRGKIWVESTLGQGATFFFSLPHK